MLDSGPLCESCGMITTNNMNYVFCSRCVEYRYRISGFDPTLQPPVVTPRGLALASVLIEANHVEIDRWNEYHSRKTAIVRDEFCTPNSLKAVNSSELLFDYLENLCEMMDGPVHKTINFTTSMKNARTAVLSETKRLLYGKLGISVQIDPFERGSRKQIFENIDSRIRI